jgi:hypothetical protein
LGFGLLLGAVYTGYWYGTESAKFKFQGSKLPSETQTQPTPIPTPVSLFETTPTRTPLTETFQQILTRNCRKIGDERSFFHGIDLSALPVLIDPAVIDIRTREQGAVVCTGEIGGSAYVYIEYGDNYGLSIYDKDSKELGHGGPSFLGIAVGPIIKETKNTKLAIYIAWPDGGPALVGDLSVIGRGEKELQLSNGETIFANTSRVVIDGSDPRLVELLSRYSKESESVTGRKEIDGSLIGEVGSGVVDRFFSNLANIESPERENIEDIEKALDAVIAR